MELKSALITICILIAVHLCDTDDHVPNWLLYERCVDDHIRLILIIINNTDYYVWLYNRTRKYTQTWCNIAKECLRTIINVDCNLTPRHRQCHTSFAVICMWFITYTTGKIEPLIELAPKSCGFIAQLERDLHCYSMFRKG